MEVRDQILEELKDAITNGELDSIIKRINKATLDIDKTVVNAENYMKRVFKTIKKDSSKIREHSERLASEHTEKIWVQLLHQPIPPFLSS